MPFTKVSIADFQSIASAEVDLGVREGGGGVTLLVGPSSTGKSAFVRAVKMLVRNVSSAPVRTGAKKTVVSAEYNGHNIEVQRGKALSTYTVDGEVFTKTGVSVPEAVAKVLGLREGMHFSGQFDSPYLLAVPGSTVSAALGALTHANVLRAAVREGARLAQHAKHEKEMRTADALALAGLIKERFAGLPAREQALVNARKRVSEAVEAQVRVDTLGTILEALEAASTGLETVSAARRRYDAVFPAVEAAAEAVERAAAIEEVVSLWDRATMMKTAQEEMAAAFAQDAEAADGEYHTVLVEAGMCPTCGAKTS